MNNCVITYRGTTVIDVVHCDSSSEASSEFDYIVSRYDGAIGDRIELRDRFGCRAAHTVR